MHRIVVSVITLAIPVASQTPSTGSATTKATCSPANTGHHNTFNITCGIGKEQGEQLLRILNTILSKQLDPATVMAKLDGIHDDVRQIKDSQGWVDLTEAQIQLLVQATKAFAGQKVFVDVEQEDRDTRRLANQLTAALNSAGWNASVSQAGLVMRPPGQLPTGIVLCRSENTPAFVALGVALQKIFGPSAFAVFRDPNLPGDLLKISVWWKGK